MQETIQIIRYANRKIYNKNTSRYIGLKDVAKYIQEGKVVEIHDRPTRTDITRTILTRVIAEAFPPEKESINILYDIIKCGGYSGYIAKVLNGENKLQKGNSSDEYESCANFDYKNAESSTPTY